MFFRPVQAADRPIIVRLEVVEDEREVDAAVQLSQTGCLCLDQLEQEGFARLQLRVLRPDAESEH